MIDIDKLKIEELWQLYGMKKKQGRVKYYKS